MKLNPRFGLGILPLVVGALILGLATAGYAQDDPSNPLGTSDGATAAALSCQLYNQTKALMEGQIGVLVGLILVFIGLWNLITGKGWFSAILAIVVGAAIPSVPGLVESFVSGYRQLMIDSGMTPSTINSGTNNEGQQTSHDVFDMTDIPMGCVEGNISQREQNRRVRDTLDGTIRGL